MTESEWRTCTDPQPMLDFLKGKASDRKLRLFAVACCRRIWHLLTDQRSQKAVEVAERFADGEVSDEQLKAVSVEAASVGIGFGIQYTSANAAHFAALPGQVFADRGAMYAARAVTDPGEPAAPLGVSSSELAEKSGQSSLLREIFGNPFRPITLDPSWLTPKVVTLAQAIYDDRAFDRMPELAVALEKAGCDDAEMLSHCRGPGPHVRGCWVVDLLLGKE